jgi:hypothetical protein
MLRNAKDTSLCGADVFAIADIVGNAVFRNLIFSGLPDDIPPAEQLPEANDNLSNCITYSLDPDHGGTESKTLEEAFKADVDYNFVEHRQELLYLHLACKHAHLVGFLQRVIRHTKDGGNNLLQALFKLKDAQGRTLLHVAVEEDGLGNNLRDIDMDNIIAKKMLGILDEEPPCDAVTSHVFLNALDLAGRTPLHRAVANKRAGRKVINALVNHPMTDVNALWEGNNQSTGSVTALHLAVLHNNVHAAGFLLAKDRTDGEIKCKLFIEASGIRSRNDDNPKLSRREWTALELATIMGEVHMVDEMLKVCD